MIEDCRIGPCSPFFIVKDVAVSVQYYEDALGFACRFRPPGNRPEFAIVGRDSAQIMLKSVEGVAPLPNPQRHEWARWDAFVHVSDPDALAQELTERNAGFHEALKDTDDGLRGFEITDPDGYICFFGRPRETA